MEKVNDTLFYIPQTGGRSFMRIMRSRQRAGVRHKANWLVSAVTDLRNGALLQAGDSAGKVNV